MCIRYIKKIMKNLMGLYLYYVCWTLILIIIFFLYKKNKENKNLFKKTPSIICSNHLL